MRRKRNFIQKAVRENPRFKTKAHGVGPSPRQKLNPRNWDTFEGDYNDEFY